MWEIGGLESAAENCDGVVLGGDIVERFGSVLFDPGLEFGVDGGGGGFGGCCLSGGGGLTGADVEEGGHCRFLEGDVYGPLKYEVGKTRRATSIER